MEAVFNFKLRNAPLPVKVLVISFLFTLGLGYIYALANVVLVVGMSPKEVAVHYYGAEKKIKKATPAEADSGESEFSFDELDTASPEPVIQPSIKKIVAEGHFHIFGMAGFFFAMTLLLIWVPLSIPLKGILMALPYISIILDNLSFLATRLLGPKFSYLVMFSGALMALSFTLLWSLILWETLKSGKEGV